jgi:hypothetical protein
MNMESRGGMTMTGKNPEELGETPVPVLLCSQQIQYRLIRGRNRTHSERLVTNYLSHVRFHVLAATSIKMTLLGYSAVLSR